MFKYIILILVSISIPSKVFAQNKVSVDFGYGKYLINSENSMKVLEDENIRSYLFFGVGFQKENVFGYNFILEYNYFQTEKKDVLDFYHTDDGGNVLGGFSGDFVLINHTFDLNYLEKINQYFSYGLGPSFVITNRIIDIDVPNLVIGNESIDNDLYDKLASSGLGLNGFFEFSFPFSENKEHFFLSSKIKLRYTYSIWFDEGVRKLDDYYQEFFTAQVSIGAGYFF